MPPMVAFTPFGFEFPLAVMVLGVIIGMTYGLLAVGLVLVFRANKIINFAQGQIGLFAAAMFAVIVAKWGVPYYAALPILVAIGAGVAALAEMVVIRRLRRAPRLMGIVATLGVGQFLLFFASALNPNAGAGIVFPVPPGLPEFQIGALRLNAPYVGILIFGPLAIAGVTLFLRRSRYGLAIRASSANPDAARMSGISVNRMSALTWAIAGALSALTAVFVLPAQGLGAGDAFGPSLLLRALAAAVLARMVSLPIALLGGIAIGVIEQLLLWHFPLDPHAVDVVLYVVILGALLLQRNLSGREEEQGSWSAVQAWRPLPEAVAGLREIRFLPKVLAVVGVVFGIALPLIATNSDAVTFSAILAFSIVGISVTIISGLGGQLSLGQFGVAAVGAAISFHLAQETDVFPIVLLVSGLGAAAVSIAIGLPALRIRGLMLTVTTLGFAVVTTNWLLRKPWALGDSGANPGDFKLFGSALDTGKSYYYFVLALFVLMMFLAHNVRRGGVGRRLIGVRDNEDNARAFTVRAGRVKLQGFLLAGFVAGVGGASYGHLLSHIDGATFPVTASIDVVAMVVIGGISLLIGPLIGAVYIIGIPRFLPLDAFVLAATQLGWLVLILLLPGGIGQALEPVRNRYALWAARRNHVDLKLAEAAPSDAIPGGIELPAVEVRATALPSGQPILEAHGLVKRFGGVQAVSDVSVHVNAGQVVGLIGPNGAGKTTTFELLSGFTRPDRGSVAFLGADVTRLSPEQRADRGLIRSFQDTALFPTMTVLDTVVLALERTRPTRFLPALLGYQGPERKKQAMARELIGAMGLNAYRNKRIRELSTGTRRIVEIACLIALRPALLLLDEPSSGVAQRETEALGRLLRRMNDELGLAMLVIEHDIPLIMALADHIVVMDAGTVISEGAPEAVQNDPLVVEAYLGTNAAAIERSDALTLEPTVGSGAGGPERS
jgi:ABC-type branched-subunit amino acid transport system ATPase component/ABC-type branched-subunit amino acid transport system permease subunit